jgi:hypothetical protein
LIVLAWIAAAAALLPALLFRRNLALYRPLPAPSQESRPRVSVLVPARDEEGTIARAVEAALASTGVELEVVVLDDRSTDRTAEIVAAIARTDPRVRLATAPPLPAGWCGKQHASAVLAGLARYEILAFVDADVRLAPAALSRAAAFLATSGAGLVSGFPHQETGSFLEHLLLPLMHFVLLGFLPIERMRASLHPAYGVGCGQLFVARREAYEKAGGHTAIRASLHDGLHLPRAFRQAGFATDLFDATDAADCRMYHDAAGVWHGLTRNATAGLAAPGKIVPVTALLLAGQVLSPILLLLVLASGLGFGGIGTALPALVGTVAAYYPRLTAVRRFRQPLPGALLHPFAILVFLALQWYSLARKLAGRPAGWKGRVYAPG